MHKKEITIFTDGSSLGNPGPGGWSAVILSSEGKVYELGGRENESTNNRMEMTAAIEALRFITHRKLATDGKTQISILTDSAYLMNGITLWIYGWAKNGWKTKAGDPVLNKDLWEDLFKINLNLKHEHEVEWKKVAGHAGVTLNERCDEIAVAFASEEKPILFTGTLSEYERLFGSVGDTKGGKSAK